jgi:hypothetical protein
MAISSPTTAGQVLTSAYVNNNINSGLVYITDVALTTAALDGIFTSEYDNYRIVVSDAYFATTGGLILFRYRDTANASVSLANYQAGALRFDSTGTAFNFGNTGQTEGSTAINATTGVGSSAGFVMDIYGPRLARPTQNSLSGVGTITGACMVQSSSRYTENTAMAGISFFTSAGTFANGRIFVYGYRKA